MAIVVKRKKPSLWDRVYLPAIIKGMFVTFRHLVGKKITVQYPEEQREQAVRSRGAHRLHRDEQGRVKCVACEMCSTACPADCITIVPNPAPWEDRDKFPEVFKIDMLRCIFCGYCVEACPEDCISMTPDVEISGYTREELIWDKAKLLDNWDKTVKQDRQFFDAEQLKK